MKIKLYKLYIVYLKARIFWCKLQLKIYCFLRRIVESLRQRSDNHHDPKNLEKESK